MRIRTIKPEFFIHEELQKAEAETGLPLRLAYIGLWCSADREGRFKWEPRRLGVQILPYDNVEFSRVLDALVTRGFLVRYACGTGVFGAIPSFKRHQIINNKERASDIPPGPLETILEADSNACPTREARVGHACHKEGKGREGKDIEREPQAQEPPCTEDEAWKFAQSVPVSPAWTRQAVSKWWSTRAASRWVRGGINPVPITRDTWRDDLRSSHTWASQAPSAGRNGRAPKPLSPMENITIISETL